jgi:hypothetical protein
MPAADAVGKGRCLLHAPGILWPALSMRDVCGVQPCAVSSGSSSVSSLCFEFGNACNSSHEALGVHSVLKTCSVGGVSQRRSLDNVTRMPVVQRPELALLGRALANQAGGRSVNHRGRAAADLNCPVRPFMGHLRLTVPPVIRHSISTLLLGLCPCGLYSFDLWAGTSRNLHVGPYVAHAHDDPDGPTTLRGSPR